MSRVLRLIWVCLCAAMLAGQGLAWAVGQSMSTGLLHSRHAGGGAVALGSGTVTDRGVDRANAVDEAMSLMADARSDVAHAACHDGGAAPVAVQPSLDGTPVHSGSCCPALGSHCAAACVAMGLAGMAVLPNAATWHPVVDRAGFGRDGGRPVPASFIPDGPERPPCGA